MKFHKGLRMKKLRTSKKILNKHQPLDIWSLREIYRKKLVSLGRWDTDSCEDLSQEMILCCLERNKAVGISINHCSFKWLLSDSVKRVFGNYKTNGALELYDESLNENVSISSYDIEDWFASNWVTYTPANNGNGNVRAKYKCSVNSIEIVYDSQELSSMLKQKEVFYDRAAISNFLKRGAVFYLLHDKLIRSSHPVKNATRVKIEFMERAE